MSWRGSGERGQRGSSKRRSGVRPLTPRAGYVPSSRWRSKSRIRRVSAGIAPARVGAVLGLVAAIVGLYAVTTADAFVIRQTQVTGSVWTTQADIVAALAVPSAQNAFELSTAELAGRLAAVTAVRSASIRIVLPDTLAIAVTEREPLLAWEVGTHRYLVDATGLLFAELRADADPAAVAALPLVVDLRNADVALATASHVDAVTLDAALRLGSLTPSDLGSSAKLLAIHLDDTDGFSITSSPAGWTAVFGFYTPTLRTTDLVPGQVRLLRSLILGREAHVLRIVLADDGSGTYIPRATGSPAAASPAAASLKPGATPRPSVTP